MKRRVFGLGMLAFLLVFARPAAAPAQSLPAEDASDPERVIAVVKELFPEVDSQSVLPSVRNQPVARLTANIGFDAARLRARQWYDTARPFLGGALLAGFADRTRTRDIALAVAAPGGRIVGTAVIARRGKGISIEVFPAPPREAAPLPPRRALPEPVMWLFPMVSR